MIPVPRIASAFLLVSLPLLAHAGADRVVHDSHYWGVHGGQNQLDRLDVHAVYSGGKTYDGRADLEHGSHVGVQLGRRTGYFRHEIEFEAGDFRVRHLAAGPIDADVKARGHYQAAFANGYGVGRLSDALDVFAGAGLGWGRSALPHLVMKSACTCFGAASKAGFAWQVRAGLAFHLSGASDVALQYTRLRLPGAETAGPPAVRYGRPDFGAWTLGWTSQF